MHVTYSASATYSELLKKYGTFGDMISDLIKKVSSDFSKGKISHRDYQKFVMVLEAKAPLSHTHISLSSLPSGDMDNSVAGLGAGSDNALDTRLGDKLKTIDRIEHLLGRKSIIVKLLEDLPELECRLIKMYYGLDGFEPHTYHELSKQFKCSKQRAHQWHKRITDKLRDRLKRMCLEDKMEIKELLSEN
jgi:DNA-directed RNA polymerase specialized sigma subunit